MTKLNKLNIAFDQEQHTYTNSQTGEMYVGITSTLLNHLFPNKYAGIPKKKLDEAASHGTLVHEDIELAESIGCTPATEEGANYIALKQQHNLTYLASEYTICDFKHFATKIDCIYEVENNIVDIADYKTTSKFDKDYVSWQLSICAYLFEKNNPDVNVRKLFGIWLRGDIAQLIEVERKSAEQVEELIEAYLKGEPLDWHPTIPTYISENEATLYALGKKIKELTDEYETLKADVLAKMQEHGDKSFDTGNILITYVAPTSRESFDSKRFKEENAELYGKYMKQSETKPTLKLTLR